MHFIMTNNKDYQKSLRLYRRAFFVLFWTRSTDPWCNMPQTLERRKIYKEKMSHEETLSMCFQRCEPLPDLQRDIFFIKWQATVSYDYDKTCSHSNHAVNIFFLTHRLMYKSLSFVYIYVIICPFFQITLIRYAL